MRNFLTHKRKVLLSVFACDPQQGSEPYVGWQWFLLHDHASETHILTRKHHAEALIGAGVPHDRLHAFDLPGFAGKDHRSPRIKAYYVAWQFVALLVALRLNREHKFDFVHHVTYNVIELPGFLWMLPTKFIWGPVGGGQVPPRQLRDYYGRSWFKQEVRGMSKRLAKFSPLVRGACRKATLVLVANEETMARLPTADKSKYYKMLETSAEPRELTQAHAEEDLLRIIWIGQLEPRKAPHLALDVVQELAARHVPFELLLVGAGPQDAELRQRVSMAPLLRHPIRILGSITRGEVLKQLESAHVLLFTSLQDTSGNVMLEALASGVPVVALDHQGSREIVCGDAGTLVPVRSKSEVVTGLADALCEYRGVQHRGRIASSCLKRAAELSWPQKRRAFEAALVLALEDRRTT